MVTVKKIFYLSACAIIVLGILSSARTADAGTKILNGGTGGGGTGGGGTGGTFSASCAANQTAVPSGGSVIFSANASGGIAPYLYLWRYPNGLASCPNPDSSTNTSSNYQTCATVPLSSPLNFGDFNVTVTDSSGVSSGQISCPGISIIPPQPQIRFAYGTINYFGSPLVISRDPASGLPDATVSHIGTGHYRITFASGVFSERPSISVNPNYTSRSASIYPQSNPQVWDVYISATNLTRLEDRAWNFIAVGNTSNPRNDLSVIFGSSSGAASGNWSITNTASGLYQLSFSAGVFESAPVVVGNSWANTNCIGINPVSASSFTVYTSGGGYCHYGGNTPFGFIAVGPSSAPNMNNLRVSEGNIGGFWGSWGTGDYSASVVSPTISNPYWSINFSTGIFSSAPIGIGNVIGTSGHLCLAYSFGSSGGSGVESGSDSGSFCTYDQGAFATDFIAVGQGVAQTVPVLATSFVYTTNLGAQISTSVTAKSGQNASVKYWARNIGPSASSLDWNCVVDTTKMDPATLNAWNLGQLTVNFNNANCGGNQQLPGGAPNF